MSCLVFLEVLFFSFFNASAFSNLNLKISLPKGFSNKGLVSRFFNDLVMRCFSRALLFPDCTRAVASKILWVGITASEKADIPWQHISFRMVPPPHCDTATQHSPYFWLTQLAFLTLAPGFRSPAWALPFFMRSKCPCFKPRPPRWGLSFSLSGLEGL